MRPHPGIPSDPQPWHPPPRAVQIPRQSLGSGTPLPRGLPGTSLVPVPPASLPGPGSPCSPPEASRCSHPTLVPPRSRFSPHLPVPAARAPFPLPFRAHRAGTHVPPVAPPPGRGRARGQRPLQGGRTRGGGVSTCPGVWGSRAAPSSLQGLHVGQGALQGRQAVPLLPDQVPVPTRIALSPTGHHHGHHTATTATPHHRDTNPDTTVAPHHHGCDTAMTRTPAQPPPLSPALPGAALPTHLPPRQPRPGRVTLS